MDNLPKTKAEEWRNKRHEDFKYKESDSTNGAVYVIEHSHIMQSFSKFQKELDSQYDKRERIVKLSRDITIFSKRVIFALHRTTDAESLPQVLADVESKLDTIKGYLAQIANELVGEDPYKFSRAYSCGIQEFVEAVTCMHFIRENGLLSYEALCERYLSFEADDVDCTHSNLLLSPADYILGIADLTGELMKMCINHVSAGKHERALEICNFIRTLHENFLVLSIKEIKNLKKKLMVLRQSLIKVENACYVLQLQGLEVPSHMLADLIELRQLSINAQPLECSD